MQRKRTRALTGKQRLFIAAYLENGMNGVRAAQAAGYKGEYLTLSAVARENLQKPLIKKAIEAKLRQRTMGADEVLARLSDIAGGTMDDFIDPDSLSVDLRQAASNGKLHLVKKIKYVTVTKDDSQVETTEFELYSAHEALRDLAKYHKLLTTQIEIADWRKEAQTLNIPADSLLGKAIADVESALSDKDESHGGL